jgi:methanogenic corrinoid protein MtbC1
LRLKRLTGSGYRISHVARLDNGQIDDLLSTAAQNGDGYPLGDLRSDRAISRTRQDLIASCLSAVKALDPNLLHQHLERSAMTLGRPAFLRDVIEPFMGVIGRKWAAGSLRIAHGQIAATVTQAILSRTLLHQPQRSPGQPRLLTATPVGQHCHLGAMSVAVMAQDHGWRPLFAGPNLPGEEIAATARLFGPQLIALSITCRVDEAFLERELSRLSRLLDGMCPIVIGGRASAQYQAAIRRAGARLCTTSRSFECMLG